MIHIVRKFSALLMLMCVISSTQLAAAADLPGKNENKVDVLGKLQNHSYLDFKPIGKVELPRFFQYDGQWYFFSSTTAAINSGEFTDEYYLENDEILKDGMVKPITYHIVGKDGEHIGLDFSLSSHLVFFLFSGLLLTVVALPLKSKYSAGIGRVSAPKGTFQNMMETLIIFLRDDITKANIGPKYEKFAPYIITAFFMILFMNLFGLMPWGVSSTADVTVTAALATTTFFITQLFASKDHWKHVFWFPDVPVWIKFLLMPVEIIGLFTKPFALCIRLFANMASGKVLIFSIIGLIFVFANLFGSAVAYGTSWIWILFALFIYVIKVVVAFLQAYIFAMLSALFIGMAVAEHEHDH